MSNEHTEQSERDESNKERLSRLAREAGALVENWMTNPPRPGLFYMTPEQLEQFAILLAADKPAESGGEAVLPEFYAELEYNTPDWDVLVSVYRRVADSTPVLVHQEKLKAQEPSSALPAEVVKDAELIGKLKECRSSVKFDYNNFDRLVMRKTVACSLNQCDTDELKRLGDLLDYIDALPDAAIDAAMLKEEK